MTIQSTRNELISKFTNDFESLASRIGFYNVFEDFLDVSINAWCKNYNWQRETFTNRYPVQSDRIKFTQMILDVINIKHEALKVQEWYDFYGEFYEEQSLSKQKGFAQFFTPPSICRLMAMFISNGNELVETVSDPCCGSGRLSLAKNEVSIGLFHHLVDLDFTCVKMAALNLMYHGIHGIVICDNTLGKQGESFRGAFIVNRKLQQIGIPEIEYIDDSIIAYNYGVSLQKVKDSNEVKKEQTILIEELTRVETIENFDFEERKEVIETIKQEQQLSLF